MSDSNANASSNADADSRISTLDAENERLRALVEEQAGQIQALRALVDRFADLSQELPKKGEPHRAGPGRPTKRRDLLDLWREVHPLPKRPRGRRSNIPPALMERVLDLVAMHLVQSEKKYPLKEAVDAVIDLVWDSGNTPEERLRIRRWMTEEYKKTSFNESSTIRNAKQRWLTGVREKLKKEYG